MSPANSAIVSHSLRRRLALIVDRDDVRMLDQRGDLELAGKLGAERVRAGGDRVEHLHREVSGTTSVGGEPRLS